MKLWILDDIVLDLSEFRFKHPGGSFVMNHTVGKDISKFFYGGYALDSNSPVPSNKSTPVWNHSNIARKIVNQLAVARYVRARTPTFSARICDKVALNTHTATYTLKCDQVIKGLSNYYPDLSTLGKHFLVSAPNFRKSGKIIHRHYTIANCMQKLFYNDICGDEKMTAPKFRDSDEFCMSIKNYNVGGLS
jgi:hypothetical protein